MFVDIDNLNELINAKGWSTYKLSKLLNMDYSYVHRVMKKESQAGNKFIHALVGLCEKNDLNINNYIFLNRPLHKNNKTA